MAVDSDTKKYLDEVKKGKPRRFVMICKGVNIVSLVVYKKGTVEKYKKQAKAEGKGQFFHGVVDGKGANIAFKLQTSDGYDSPPGKELILKSFLKTEAGMQFKPTYEIVEALPEIDESDESSLETESSPPTSGPSASSSDQNDHPGSPPDSDLPPVAPPTDELANQFKVRLTGLVPQIKQAAGTPAGELAKAKASEAVAFSRSGDFAGANASLDQVEQALQSEPGGTPPPSPPEPSSPAPPPPPTSGGDQAARVKERLAGLVPKIKQAAGTPTGDEAKLKAGAAAACSRDLNFVQANALLDQVEDALHQFFSAAPEAAPQRSDSATEVDASDNDLANQFKARLTQLVPQIKQAAGSPLGEQAKLKAGEAAACSRNRDFVQANRLLDEVDLLVGHGQNGDSDSPSLQRGWEQRSGSLEPRLLEAQKTRTEEAPWMTLWMSAQDLASQGQLDKANGILDRLERMLVNGPPKQAAEMKAALAHWNTARGTVVAQLEKLRAAIKADADETAAEAIIEVRGVQANLTANPDKRQKVIELIQYLESDDVVADVDQPNPYGIDIDLQVPLLEALDEILLHMPD